MWGVIFDVGLKIVDKVLDRAAKGSEKKAAVRLGRLEALAERSKETGAKAQAERDILARVAATRDEFARSKELPNDGYRRD